MISYYKGFENAQMEQNFSMEREAKLNFWDTFLNFFFKAKIWLLVAEQAQRPAERNYKINSFQAIKEIIRNRVNFLKLKSSGRIFLFFHKVFL